jgi:DNA-binding transcriptional LysR family regulator
LTKIITQLEKEIGVFPLFDNVGRKESSTNMARFFYVHARKILVELDNLATI